MMGTVLLPVSQVAERWKEPICVERGKMQQWSVFFLLIYSELSQVGLLRGVGVRAAIMEPF